MFSNHSKTTCEPARMLTELTFVTDGRFVKAAKKFGDLLVEAAV